jgi:hypothetical protein
MADKKQTPVEDQPQDKQEQLAEESNAQVQERVDQETEQGFRGVEVDQTPNENYTVAGVTAGLPVPEAAEVPREARRLAAGEK